MGYILADSASTLQAAPGAHGVPPGHGERHGYRLLPLGPRSVEQPPSGDTKRPHPALSAQVRSPEADAHTERRAGEGAAPVTALSLGGGGVVTEASKWQVGPGHLPLQERLEPPPKSSRRERAQAFCLLMWGSVPLFCHKKKICSGLQKYTKCNMTLVGKDNLGGGAPHTVIRQA